ncbi:hypothetical protein MSAN_00422200 [Mycena sanguinolenta]|uniref:Uncharacterized protein n=1 Tax=Mycena sanguinolenta TaxID=230812 RepID=A0A8H6ZGU8_9AGAR|nr:hypothetical protein MSAN_00422200 [Mycena sanguinolenta]
MGGLQVTEMLIINAPPALNLLANLTQWLNEILGASASATSNSAGSRMTMRKGKMVSLKDSSSSEIQNLVNNLATAVRNAFAEEYGYPYNGADSSPRHAQTQGGVPIMFVAGEDFANCASNNSSAIAAYIVANVGAGDVPNWAQNQLINNLAGFLMNLLNGPPTNAWISRALPTTFTGGASGSIVQADVMLLYCITNAPDPKNLGQNVNTLFCKYVAISYLGQGWPALTGQNVGVPGTAQILAVDCSVSDPTLATALGVQIVRTQPSSVNTIFSVTSGKLSVGVAPKRATATDGTDAGGQQPVVASLGWVVDILKDNKVTYTTQTRNATPGEYQELQYLDNCDTVAAFKRGDFTSVQ